MATSRVRMQYPSLDSLSVFVENSLMNLSYASSSYTFDLMAMNMKIMSSWSASKVSLVLSTPFTCIQKLSMALTMNLLD